MSDLIRALEKDTGFRLRVLCQNYPNTPGLAIRDFWSLGKEDQKDDKYIVLVVDEFGGKGNVLNFNVGDGVKFALPNVFWTRLSGKYGTVSVFVLCFSLLIKCWKLNSTYLYCCNIISNTVGYKLCGMTDMIRFQPFRLFSLERMELTLQLPMLSRQSPNA